MVDDGLASTGTGNGKSKQVEGPINSETELLLEQKNEGEFNRLLGKIRRGKQQRAQAAGCDRS